MLLGWADGPGRGWLEGWLDGREDSSVYGWGDDSELILGGEGDSAAYCLDVCLERLEASSSSD